MAFVTPNPSSRASGPLGMPALAVLIHLALTGGQRGLGAPVTPAP
jgi:hypothetical protein